MTSELQQIVDTISTSYNSGNKRMFNVAVQDLYDIANQYEKLSIEFRFVSVNGDRIYACGNLPSTPKVREVNGLTNHVLIDKYMKLLNRGIPKDQFFKYFKHLNDMSPEEYAWCIGIE